MLKLAVMAFADGEPMVVSALCAREGVSTKTFYKYVARYRAEGEAGFEVRSRRPNSSPGQTPFEVEDRIVVLRKQLDDAGLDHGPTTLQWHLLREPTLKGRVPSVATIHRILVRRGLVTPQPHKRPKSSWIRFEAPRPNEWWQIDFMQWIIATGAVSVFNIMDDHSRVLARSKAVEHPTTTEAWATFCEATLVWGMPAGVLSDNGLAFSGKLHGFETVFEANLRDAGIRPFTGRPFHPQTTGKVERFQQTLKKWLRKQPLAADVVELQAQLDTFADYYNHERPHQGIGRVTPASRWHASDCATPSPSPLEHPDYAPRKPTRHDLTVRADGRVGIGRYTIHIGVAHAGRSAVVMADERWVNVYIDGLLIRHSRLDPTRRNQPSGKPRGGPRQQRLAN
jgi:transposase InsO family protein